MLRILSSVSFALLLAGLVHCGGSSDDPTPTPNTNASPSDPAGDGNDASASTEDPKKDAGASADATPTNPNTPNNPSSCNTLVNDATPITFISMVAQAAPAPTGGAMVNGTYHLKSITLYAPGGTATTIPLNLKNTVKVQGNVVEQVFDGTKIGSSGNQETIAERSTESFSTTNR